MMKKYWYVYLAVGGRMVGTFQSREDADWFARHYHYLDAKAYGFDVRLPGDVSKPYFWVTLGDDMIGPWDTPAEAGKHRFMGQMDHRVVATAGLTS